MSAPFRVSLLIDGDASDANAALRSVGKEARQTGKETATLGGTVATAGKRSAQSANNMKMLAYQLNQVGQQGAVTGNYMQALMIQLPDVLAVAGGLPGVLAGGIIAIGASFIPGLMSGGKAAKGFQTDIEELSAAISDYRQWADIAVASTDDLAERFGNAGGRAKEAAAILAEYARIEAIKKLKADVKALAGEFGGLDRAMLVPLDTSRGFFASWLDTDTPIGLVTEFENTVRTMREELGLTESEATAVADALSDLGNADGVQAQVDTAIALDAQLKAVFGSTENIPPELQNVGKSAAQIAAEASKLGDEFDNSADAVWRIDEALNSVIAGVNGAVTSAEALELAFLNAAGAASSIALPAPPDVTVTPLGDPPTMVGGYTQQEMARGYSALAYYADRPTPTPRRPAGGGGAAAEADAVQELIKSLEEEIALARKTDPVQKELLRNREALAGATDEERAAVEELIRTRMEEERAAAAAAEASDFFAQTAYDALEGLILQGDSLSDTFDNLAMAIAQAALQAALLGTGPLAGIFGMGESGGALGMIFGSLFGQAEGGMVYGPGTGTSDSVPRRLSNGEFVVNAAATQRNRHALEAINSGHDVPGLASGGYVGPPANLAAAPAGSAVPINITVENRSSVQVEGQVEEFTSPSGQRSMKMVLSDQVGASLTQPGGGAKKVLGNRYGIRQRGTRR